jgi:predicted esterase
MEAKPRTIAIYFIVTGLLAVGLSLVWLEPIGAPAPTSTSTPKDASGKDFIITDFEAVHSPVKNDPYAYLIFGNLPVSPAAPGLSPDLAAFLGRWEGYDFSPPVKKDSKGILLIQEISAQGGKAFLWAGTNLQYPYWIKEIQFKVVPGAVPTIEWEADLTGAPGGAGGKGIFRLAYDRENQSLRGGIDLPSGSELDGLFSLNRDQTFFVYKDYGQYLSSKRISAKEYQNKDLPQFGKGYMLYLPEGYEDNPSKTWPLILFLHGAGDRGDNIDLLAKASPFMMIREKGPLPFIIVAPLLNASQSEFPMEYLDGVLAEVQAAYRVDRKRIYATGLSLGGKAAFRFAVQHPDTFAAIATLSAYADSETLPMIGRIKDLPVWAIHGADDAIVPLALAQQTADALKAAGGNIQFTVLAGHDHDTWSDTYSDPAFYDWLLQYQTP